jgi:prophage tail gpP-like protein
VRLFHLADVLQFRRENAETSGRYKRMSDAELDLEALKRARVEVLDDANTAAIEMSQAQQRMDRCLARAQKLKEQIEVAHLLLDERDRQRILATET